MDTLRALCHDTKEVRDFSPADLRYGPRNITGRISLGLTASADNSRDGDVPYYQPDPARPVCVRVDVIPSLAQCFRHVLSSCPEGSPSEVYAVQEVAP